MVSGRPHPRVGEAGAGQDALRRRERAVDRAPRCEPGIGVQGREGIDAEIAGAQRQLLGRPLGVADREHVGIDRLAGRHQRAGAPQIVDEGAGMDGADVIFREGARREALERHRLLQLTQYRRDAHGRFDVAAVLHVVDLVLVVDHQRNPIGDRSRRRLRRFGLAPQIAQRSQPDRVVLDRFHDHVGVLGRHSSPYLRSRIARTIACARLRSGSVSRPRASKTR